MARALRQLRDLRKIGPQPDAIPDEAFAFMLRAYETYLSELLREIYATDPTLRRTDASLLEKIRAMLGRLDEFLTGRVASFVFRATDTLRDSVDTRFKRVAPFNVSNISPRGFLQVQEFRQKNVSLISAVGKEYLGAIENVLISPTALSPYKGLPEAFQKITNITQNKAKFWAVDQTLKLNADLTEARHREAGVTRYKWHTVGPVEERVRGNPSGKWPDGHHYQLNGNTYSYDDPPIVDLRSGRRANPGQDYRCRCLGIPVFDD